MASLEQNLYLISYSMLYKTVTIVIYTQQKCDYYTLNETVNCS